MTSVISLVRHYQKDIENRPEDVERVMRCLTKLHRLEVTVQHLQDTGVGRTVNALRKDPGEIGSAARALVAKWKNMVAEAEDSEEEDEHNSGRDSTEDSDHNANQYRHEIMEYESGTDDYNTTQSRTNGDDNRTAKRHYDCEDEDRSNGLKRTKFSEKTVNKSEEEKTNIKKYNRDSQVNSEDQYDDNDNDFDPSSDIQTFTNKDEYTSQDAKEKQKIKMSNHTSTETLKYNRESVKSSSSHKEKSELKHKSEKGTKHSKISITEEKDKKKHRESKHSSESNKCDKTSSSDKYKQVEKLSKSSEKAFDSIHSYKEKHCSSSEKHKTSKHKDSSKESEKLSKNRDKAFDQETISEHKGKSKIHHSSSSHKEKYDKCVVEQNHSTKKMENEYSVVEKQRNCDISKKSNHSDQSSSYSHKKKTESSSKNYNKRKDSESSGKANSDNEKTSGNSSKHKISSLHQSSSSKSKDDMPKKKSKSKKEKTVDSDDGIDCESGASFAEALGMVSPVKAKKKSHSKDMDVMSPSNGSNVKPSASNSGFAVPASLLAPSAKLEPLQPLEISALPEISPNYKPRPPPRLLPQASQDDALNYVMSNKNQRTKIFSGNKTYGKVLSLYELCVNVLQEHIDALEYTGGVPYDILKPVVDKASPDQLFALEHFNPYLMDDTNHLWQKHCEKKFRNKQRLEMETWREMFLRCQEEQEARLKSLTANIKMSQDARNAPTKQTKMAYVDTMVKPPRNIARKQAIHGTARAAVTSPAARVAALAGAGVVRAGTLPARPSPLVHTSTSSSAFKPKKAPLMQKALQFMRGRKR